MRPLLRELLAEAALPLAPTPRKAQSAQVTSSGIEDQLKQIPAFMSTVNGEYKHLKEIISLISVAIHNKRKNDTGIREMFEERLLQEAYLIEDNFGTANLTPEQIKKLFQTIDFITSKNQHPDEKSTDKKSFMSFLSKDSENQKMNNGGAISSAAKDNVNKFLMKKANMLSHKQPVAEFSDKAYDALLQYGVPKNSPISKLGKRVVSLGDRHQEKQHIILAIISGLKTATENEKALPVVIYTLHKALSLMNDDTPDHVQEETLLADWNKYNNPVKYNDIHTILKTHGVPTDIINSALKQIGVDTPKDVGPRYDIPLTPETRAYMGKLFAKLSFDNLQDYLRHFTKMQEIGA